MFDTVLFLWLGLKIFVDLNGGEITYTGFVYEDKMMHLYLQVTAEK